MLLFPTERLSSFEGHSAKRKRPWYSLWTGGGFHCHLVHSLHFAYEETQAPRAVGWPTLGSMHGSCWRRSASGWPQPAPGPGFPSQGQHTQVQVHLLHAHHLYLPRTLFLQGAMNSRLLPKLWHWAILPLGKVSNLPSKYAVPWCPLLNMEQQDLERVMQFVPSLQKAKCASTTITFISSNPLAKLCLPTGSTTHKPQPVLGLCWINFFVK